MSRRPRPGPLSLLLCCLLPVVGAFALTRPGVGVVVLALDLATLGWLVESLPGTLAREAVGLVAAAGLALSTWLYAGHDPSLTAAAALRILCIVTPAAILSPRIRPSELGDHLAQRLRLPARPVAAAVAALQRVEDLGEQWRTIQRARRSRGFGPDGSPLRWGRAMAGGAFALFVSAMRSTGQLALALDARGFATAQRRTWAEPAPWLAGDWALTAVAVALAVVPWLL